MKKKLRKNHLDQEHEQDETITKSENLLKPVS